MAYCLKPKAELSLIDKAKAGEVLTVEQWTEIGSLAHSGDLEAQELVRQIPLQDFFSKNELAGVENINYYRKVIVICEDHDIQKMYRHFLDMIGVPNTGTKFLENFSNLEISSEEYPNLLWIVGSTFKEDLEAGSRFVRELLANGVPAKNISPAPGGNPESIYDAGAKGQMFLPLK